MPDKSASKFSLDDIEKAKTLVDRVNRLREFSRRELVTDQRNDTVVSARLVEIPMGDKKAPRFAEPRIKHISDLRGKEQEEMYNAMRDAAVTYINALIGAMIEELTAMGVDTDGI